MIRWNETDGTPSWRTQKQGFPAALPPTMLTDDELHYLYWLAREVYTGEGEIIDGGCLRGASTSCFAAGLRHNRTVANRIRRIHSYDLFHYEEYQMAHLFPGAGLKTGDSFLPLFEAHLAIHREQVTIVPGDILTKHWSGQPIEILFLDLVKSNEINTHVIREFFSHLIPQRSVVLQQDYYHFYCYWIHLAMAHLSEYFEIIPSPAWNTLAFRLLRPIPQELLELDYSRLPADEQVRLMELAVAREQGTRRLMVMDAQVRLLGVLGKTSAAWATAEAIYRSPDWIEQLAPQPFGAIYYSRQRTTPVREADVPPTIRLLEDWTARKSGLPVALTPAVSAVSNQRRVLIWGAGPTGARLLARSRNEGIAIDSFIDSDPTRRENILDGITVQAPETVKSESERPFVLIGSNRVREIALQLEDWGYHYGVDYVV